MRPAKGPVRISPLAWLAAGLVLALLAWQGHHVAYWLKELEGAITGLGRWGPLGLIAAILLLGPFFVPDSVFGITAGVCFGLVAGTAYCFAGMYLMCLILQAASRRWLRPRALPLLESRPVLRSLVRSAARGGARFTFLARLVPINQALLSYALGAAAVPVRFALIGDTGMLLHMFPTVYFGAAAAHVTRMAARGHGAWSVEGVLLLLGLAVCVGLAIWIGRRAWAAAVAGSAGEDGPPDETPSERLPGGRSG